MEFPRSGVPLTEGKNNGICVGTGVGRMETFLGSKEERVI